MAALSETLLALVLDVFGAFIPEPRTLWAQVAVCFMIGLVSIAGLLWLLPSLPEGAETWRGRLALCFIVLPIIGLVFSLAAALRHPGAHTAGAAAVVVNLAALALVVRAISGGAA